MFLYYKMFLGRSFMTHIFIFADQIVRDLADRQA
jgi:hypothetical protein